MDRKSFRAIGINVLIYPSAKIVSPEVITIGNNVIIDDFVFIYAKKEITIGNYVHIASFVSITGGEELIMKDFSAIASGARILTATDDFTGWGFGNPTVQDRYRNVRRGHIQIGMFSIIGANSVILPGVTIGEGAMIGACSVISKDVEPWTIYGGVNKILGKRDQEFVGDNYRWFLSEQKIFFKVKIDDPI